MKNFQRNYRKDYKIHYIVYTQNKAPLELADGHKTVPLSKQKADNQMEWVRQMNACKAQAEAIVKIELIYD